jgi:anti-anti-sigma factor
MIELTREQVDKLFEFIEEKPPVNITCRDISRVLIEIERKITPYYSEHCEDEDEIKSSKNVLVIDDLEVSIFQLKTLLLKSCYNAVIARSAEEALDIYKKQNFDYVFLDLFLPEPEDGFNLLEEFKKFDKTAVNKTKIIIISGSDDNTLINQCFVLGAYDFIGKTNEWHKKILNRLRQFDEIKEGPIPDVKTTLEDEKNLIASIKIKNINKQGVIENLKREALSLSNAGYSKIILDLENISTVDAKILNLLVSIYKSCKKNNGDLKLIHVNPSVNESLSYVFLDGLISILSSKKAALEDFYRTETQ